MAEKAKKGTPESLENEISDARKEILRLRFRRAVGESVQSGRFRGLRRSVARCLTAMRKDGGA